MTARMMNEEAIQDFWEAHPCGDSLVGGLDERFHGDLRAFFDEFDSFRYQRHPHLLRCLRDLGAEDSDVLEIGLGLGADSEQLVRQGARWSGLDLTSESVSRVRARFQLRGLPFGDIKQGSVLDIPWPDASFDLVFSHGVLHHVPDIRAAQAEIARVLRPGGRLVAMLYARRSLNYLVSILILRRLALAALVVSGRSAGGIVGEHVEAARRVGLREYLRMEKFVHRNTDGPHNPYSKVYDLATVRADFPSFTLIRAQKRYMRAPPLPVRWLPLERWLGWHLWVELERRR